MDGQIPGCTAHYVVHRSDALEDHQTQNYLSHQYYKNKHTIQSTFTLRTPHYYRHPAITDTV